nr:transcription factor IBH1-like [Tanacetum cinerariifolium]
MFRRSRRVKIAAYTAMASVVGSRRAWSRALLWKIRNRSRNRGLLLRIKKRVDHAKVSFKRRNPRPKRQDFDPFKYSSQELKLRKMVPGAETMDSCSLMSETADYIKCLVAQGGDSHEQHIHWKNWEKLSEPKHQGGLGFQDFEAFHTAVLAKHGWRQLANPDAFRGRILKGIYFSNSNFHVAKKGSHPLWLWSSLLHCRDLFLHGLRWQVGNGR